MNKLLILCLAIVAASADTGLTVKWGISGDVFIEIPRLLADILALGWMKNERYAGAPLSALDMYCPSGDLTFCVLTDDTGYIAGLQIALAKNVATDWLLEPSTLGFATWIVGSVEYFVQQQFFVSEELLAKTAAEREAVRSAANYATLAEGFVWVIDRSGALYKISTSETDIQNSVFTKQGCIPTMGLHYYYEMTTDTKCTAFFPWFELVHGGKLIATGFTAFCTYPEPTGRMWFERPGTAAVVKTIVPNGPQCLYDMAESLITMHVYYGSVTPKTITC